MNEDARAAELIGKMLRKRVQGDTQKRRTVAMHGPYRFSLTEHRIVEADLAFEDLTGRPEVVV